MRAAARASKAAAQTRDRVDELARQRPTAQDPERAPESTELDRALEVHADSLDRLKSAQRKVSRTFLAARAANRTLGASYAPHARGRDRVTNRDEVAVGLLDKLA
ncbi:hypothetical protein [Streptomyces canus]|uniref:hypothetical protein n=1 Tax=Streptomyces canus TaxID=58343 RepID=UPI000378FA40|nr:hypothetical protein [Streptomyces canus]